MSRGLAAVKAVKRLRVGDLYEDCFYHPVLCLGVSYRDDEIWGVSLIDGSHPRSCSLVHCGVRRLSPAEAWALKQNGPADPAARRAIKKTARWWSKAR